MTTLPPINLGHLPGDSPIMVRRGWKKAFTKADASIDHVRLHGKTFADSLNWQPVCNGRTYVQNNSDAQGYITVAKLRQSGWPAVAAKAVAFAQEQLQQTREAIIESRIGHATADAEAAIADIEALVGNAFTTSQLYSTWTTASAAATKAIDGQLSLAMTVKTKGFPQAVADGAMAAYQKTHDRFSAFERGVKASVDGMAAQADTRAESAAHVSQAERDALTSSLEKAKIAGFKFSKTKDFNNECEPKHVITELFRYGEIWVGASADDPARKSLTSYHELADWAAKWVGT